VSRKIQLLQRLGLGFASLWRRCKTLSGGEYQRVLLARVLGNGLTDALYILDEPSVGLGKAELPELIACLKELRDLGNTIVMVEHDKQLIESADLWFELGPGGGANGGKLLSRQSHMPKSATSEKPSKASSNRLPRPQSTESTETISLREFSALNCNAISCSFKTGTLSVITGPSGAGKSTLLHMGLEAALNLAKEHGQLSNPTPDIGELRGAWKGLLLPTNFFQTTSLIALEQNATHRSISSVIATSLGIMDFIRRQFAQSEDALRNNMSSSEFSFNSTGACENCDGKGEIPQDLFFLGEVKKACPNCAGTRFRASSLRPKWMNRNIAEWMSTTIDECLVHWDPFPLPRKQLRVAADLGLGYLPIGTSTSSLSGGELQRLRIAAALSQSTKKMLALLDEPTRGLSESDASKLLHTLLKLTRLGHTFVVVEHHALFCENAHQLLVMGPGGGQKGGQIIETLVQNTISN
jgi:excinuclease ABC subunit A